MHVNGEESLVSRDIYMSIGHEEENGKKAIQNLVPKKYKLCFAVVNPSLNQREDIFPLHKDTALLKQPGLYCFLLRCKRSRAEPFMEWVVDTVLPREVWKLALAIEEKDNQIQALEFTNEKHQQKILRLNKEIVDLVTGTYAAVDVLTTCCVSSKRIAEKFTHITLFDVSTSSLKNMSDG